jgi:ADP-ribosylation factor related protein 1
MAHNHGERRARLTARAGVGDGCCSQISLIAGFIEWATRKAEVRVPVVGLVGAGKSTLLEQAKRMFPTEDTKIPIDRIKPTIGMDMGRLFVDGVKLLVWDVGGQMESLWPSYFDGAHGLVFVCDASDDDSFERVSHTLARVLSHRAIRGLKVLLVANKQDLPSARSALAVAEAVVKPACSEAAALLDDPSVSDAALMSRVRVVEASALAGDGVKDSIHWLVASAKAVLEGTASDD